MIEKFREEYSATVEAISSFILRTAVILPLLVIAVVYPLIEYDRKQVQLRAERIQLSSQAAKTRDRLEAAFKHLKSKPLEGRVASIIQELPSLPASFDEFAPDPASIASLDWQMRLAFKDARDRLEARRAKARVWSSKDQAAAEVEEQTNGAAFAGVLGIHPRLQEAVGDAAPG